MEGASAWWIQGGDCGRRGRKRKRVTKKVRYIRKKFVYKLLATVIIVLFFLGLSWMIFLILERIVEIFPEKEVEIGGEFATLKWDFGQEEITLDILDYNIINNQTVEIKINWSEREIDEEDFNAFLIKSSELLIPL